MPRITITSDDGPFYISRSTPSGEVFNLPLADGETLEIETSVGETITIVPLTPADA